MSDRYLLTLIAPPSLEEPLVDWLLEFESEYGFSSFPVNGHSSRHEGLTLAEQVSGRRRHIRFEMHLPETELSALIERLKGDFAGAGLHYWVLPILGHGRV
jgi:hypothetical protein